MYFLRIAQLGQRTLACALVIGVSSLSIVTQAEAAAWDKKAISRCDRAYIALQVQEAMLALKAVQYCRVQPLPFNELEVLARLDELRCDAGASNMIDELNDVYDKQYRMILTQDKTQTVCKHAATLHIK